MWYAKNMWSGVVFCDLPNASLRLRNKEPRVAKRPCCGGCSGIESAARRFVLGQGHPGCAKESGFSGGLRGEGR